MPADVFGAAFNEAAVAMAVVDRFWPFRVRAANARFIEVASAGHGAGQVETRPLVDLTPDAVEAGLETALASVAHSHQPQVLVLTAPIPGRKFRHQEITLSYLKSLDALLYMGRDVTAREEHRRQLEAAQARAATFTSLARQSASLDADRVLSAAATTAAAFCDGVAAIYLAASGKFRLVAWCGMSGEGAFPEVVPDDFPLLDRALSAGASLSMPYLPSLSTEGRTLMREVGASWIAVTPVQGRQGVLGVIITLWRRAGGPYPGDLPALELAAGQLALALEHARLFIAAEEERIRLETIVEQLPDAVLIADGEGRLTQTNSVGRQLFGLAPADPLPSMQDLAARVKLRHSERPEAGDLGLAEALRGRTVSGRLYSLTTGDTGGAMWLQVAAAPLYDREERVVGAIAVATDVTERKRAEEAQRLLAEITNILTESVDYEGGLSRTAELLVGALADCCLIDLIEDDGSVRRVASSCADSVDPSLDDELKRWGPEPLARAEIAATLSLGKSRFHLDLPTSLLAELARDDAHLARLRTMQLRSYLAAPLVARGRTIGVLQLLTAHEGRRFAAADLALAEDLARRAATAVDNARLYRRAQEADRRKDEFLAVLSHELRTPLTPILTWVQLLQHDMNPAYMRQATSAIERNVRLQTALIDDLLDLTAIERGKLALDLKSTDIRDAVLAALEMVAENARKKRITLQRSLPDAAMPVEGDINRLQQVFGNLLSNAIKFTPAEGVVAVEARTEGDSAMIRVRDSGTGIAPEFLPYVFDMFRQQEEGTRRTFGGLGIGLALARRLVERHGGTLEANSDGVGRGAEFTVRLPTTATTEPPLDLSPPPEEQSPLRLDDVRILIIEDIADTCGPACLMLENLGARVSAAADGVEALEILNRTPPDVVVCDLRMPRMDGFEFLSRLRASPAHRHLPVIAISGLSAPTNRRKVEDAGFDAFLSKPFDSVMLTRTIAAVIDPRLRARAS
jgi:PAS domain S-box-containing protein